ncbi:MAG TPA: hypothetical protein PKM55_12000 [Acidobacteriota bacterium]|nr:hypothetical protein [Acidobacteriota bacterium]
MAKNSDQSIAAKREALLVLERQIQETQEECTRAEAEPERIRAAIEEAREQRGEAIARNLDLGSITRTIKKLKDDLELSEDTVKGLGMKLARLHQERETAEAGLREAIDQEEFELLKEAVAEYNRLAGELAPVVAEIYTRRGRLLESHFQGGCDTSVRGGGWDRSALESIPVLFLRGDPIPPYDSPGCSHFRMIFPGRFIVNGQGFLNGYPLDPIHSTHKEKDDDDHTV